VELRIRDDKSAPPVFPCPECQVPLRLERPSAGLITIVLADTPVRSSAPAPKTVPTHRAKSKPTSDRPDRTLWWISAGSVLLALIVIAWLSRGRNGVSELKVVVENNNPPVKDTKPSPPDVPETTPTAGLAERILSATEAWGHFPPTSDQKNGLPVTQQLSWLARLESHSATLPPERRPVLDVPWFDPANEPFVGRRVPTYLNAQVVTQVGEDGRPTTHFVGVAGVGRDAIELPYGHPRAGMFGTNRTITVSELRDGQAHTLMVLGVDAQLGSWADPGRATVRALTEEPYWHGPDGFGGGNDPQIPALMVDGSARLFAAETDPRLLRRLAAINDGLPLDLTVPGEPGDQMPAGSHSSPQTIGVAIVDPGNPAVSALTAMADSQRPIITRPPVAPLLQQRLVSFQQTKPTTRRQFLLIAEDLLGRPIAIDQESLGPLTSQLDAKVTFTLENTTIAAVLEQVLTGTELELVIGPERAVIRRKATDATAAVRIEP
jgi:hypothetical protein